MKCENPTPPQVSLYATKIAQMRGLTLKLPTGVAPSRPLKNWTGMAFLTAFALFVIPFYQYRSRLSINFRHDRQMIQTRP